MIPNNNRSISFNWKCICTFARHWFLAVVLQKIWTNHVSNIHHYPRSIPWTTLRFLKNIFTWFWGTWYATFLVIICNAHFFCNKRRVCIWTQAKVLEYRLKIVFVKFLLTVTWIRHEYKQKLKLCTSSNVKRH